MQIYSNRKLYIESHAGNVERVDLLYIVTFYNISFFVTGVNSQISRSESGPGTVRPGEDLTLTCKVTGASLTDSTNMYSVNWIRQPAGKGLEWMGRILYDDRKFYATSVQGRLTITRNTNKGEVYFKLTGMKPEDTCVYYCVRDTTGPS
uniref:Ig-like domain-containing protein n=1 Tax=Leptobrachium leishanense TaxID=445787 RepID=A0A8C5MAB8_9ANUR